jgi:hypothetical protein
VRVALAGTSVEEIDVEAILDFPEELSLDPAKMWRHLNPEHKRIFQASMFPEAVAFDGSQLRTSVTASFLKKLHSFQGMETRLASPPGCVVHPGWCWTKHSIRAGYEAGLRALRTEFLVAEVTFLRLGSNEQLGFRLGPGPRLLRKEL